MQQRSFGSVEYEHKKVKTRRQTFLERMDRLVPWAELEQRIAPVYPKRGCGRRPYPLCVMLRIHCLQLWFNLSDPGMEQELYDSRSMLEFAGLSLSGPIPDETTILNFRHLLERHQLGTALFATINAHLAARGLQVSEGTIVDSTIISAPSSTKNRERARDPEMHQTRKGRQWFFGMKLHTGTDARTGLVHKHDGGEQLRRDRGASPVARRRDGGVGRCRLPGRGEAPGARAFGGELAGGDAPESQAAAGAGGRGGTGGAAEGLGACEG